MDNKIYPCLAGIRQEKKTTLGVAKITIFRTVAQFAEGCLRDQVRLHYEPLLRDDAQSVIQEKVVQRYREAVRIFAQAAGNLNNAQDIEALYYRLMKVLETDFQRVYPGFWQQFEKKVDDRFLTSTQGMSDGVILVARLADAMGWKVINDYERDKLLAEELAKIVCDLPQEVLATAIFHGGSMLAQSVKQSPLFKGVMANIADTQWAKRVKALRPKGKPVPVAYSQLPGEGMPHETVQRSAGKDLIAQAEAQHGTRPRGGVVHPEGMTWPEFQEALKPLEAKFGREIIEEAVALHKLSEKSIGRRVKPVEELEGLAKHLAKINSNPRWKTFTHDPAHKLKNNKGYSIEMKHIEEAMSGIACEEQGLLGKLSRASDKASEFVEKYKGPRRAWDVKTASSFDFRGNSIFEASVFCEKIKISSLDGENIIINVTKLTRQDYGKFIEALNNTMSSLRGSEIVIVDYLDPLRSLTSTDLLNLLGK